MASDARPAININTGSTGNTSGTNPVYANTPWEHSDHHDSLSGFTSDYNVVVTECKPTRATDSFGPASDGQDTHSIITTPAAMFINAGATITT